MKIAVMGSAPSSARLGPFQDKSHAQYAGGKVQAYPPSQWIDDEWQIWGCSPGLFGVAPRANRWFELHRWEPGQEWFSPEYCQFLRDFKGPVYTGAPIQEIKNHVVYPIAQVEAEFSAFFLNSSLSLMAAIAIMEIEAYRKVNPDHNPKEDVIGFFGVDMSANEEYSRQKPGCWFFMLEALRRNIGLYMPPESDLGCPEPVYGICEWDHAYIKATARMREINARMQASQQTLSQAQAQNYADIGARDDLNYHIKTWISPYRLPHGISIHQEPGTGLGVTVVAVDGNRPEPGIMTPYVGAIAGEEPISDVSRLAAVRDEA